METNLSFQYGADDIFALVDAEISRHAAFLRFQDGGSAYDSIKVHTNEKPTVQDFITDAFRTVLVRFDGEGRYTGGENHTLAFYLPDFDTELESPVKDEIRRYVILSVTARWLMARSFGEYAKMVAADSDASMNRLVDMLRTRKYPIE